MFITEEHQKLCVQLTDGNGGVPVPGHVPGVPDIPGIYPVPYPGPGAGPGPIPGQIPRPGLIPGQIPGQPPIQPSGMVLLSAYVFLRLILLK